MKLYDMKLLTIICEILLNKKISEILQHHNVTGYTSYEVSGKGDSGMRGHGLPEEKNLKIEIILRQETAEKIIEDIIKTLFSDYSLVFYMTDIKVARTEKFV